MTTRSRQLVISPEDNDEDNRGLTTNAALFRCRCDRDDDCETLESRQRCNWVVRGRQAGGGNEDDTRERRTIHREAA